MVSARTASKSRGLIWSVAVGLLAQSPALLLAAPLKPRTPPPPLASATSATAPPLQLKLLRRGDGVEVVVEGVGLAPQLRQQSRGSTWEGRLTTAETKGVLLTPQRFSLPEAGLQSVSLDGGGNAFQLNITPMQGVPLGRPVVSADGKNLILSFPVTSQMVGQTSRPNLMQPGAIPQPSYAPPLQPRAVAPPLGDMAVGSMLLRNQSFVNASGPSVTLTLRNAPAKDALMAIAQLGGYGFVYVDDANQNSISTASTSLGSASPQGPSTNATAAGRAVTLGFRNENYSRALNSVLLAAGLQGKLEGRMLLVGPSVMGKSFGFQMSKVFRLNQASSSSAADYLASLGAAITKVTIISNIVSTGQAQQNQVSGASQTQQTQKETYKTTETYGASAGPLRGLSGTTDSRLQTVTLVGDPALIAIAESYLRQIDLRQRQVALTVKILDVNLTNLTDLTNRFTLPYGGQDGMPTNAIVSADGKLRNWVNTYPVQEKMFIEDPKGNPITEYQNWFTALTTSSSTKVLASPTLILSENSEPIQGGAAVAGQSGAGGASTIGRAAANEAFITVGDKVVTKVSVTPASPTQSQVCDQILENAGLTFGAKILKIDDNGFVTFAVSPEISAVVKENIAPGGCGVFTTLARRRLDTGSVRLRDGETLVIAGVISDSTRSAVKKWPIVGDLPVIGQFFRDSANSREKRELVILVTPRILDDTQGGAWGYGYRPSTSDAQRFMGGSM